MIECYIAYQSLVYICDYLLEVAVDINVPCIQNVNSINKYEGGCFFWERENDEIER